MPASTPASDPAIVLSVGFVLIVAIYIQTAMLFGVYTPELFPTEIRLRANGICNTLGRGATVVSPFIVGYLMANYQLPGVLWLMIGLVARPDRGGLGLGRRTGAAFARGGRAGRRRLERHTASGDSVGADQSPAAVFTLMCERRGLIPCPVGARLLALEANVNDFTRRNLIAGASAAAASALPAQAAAPRSGQAGAERLPLQGRQLRGDRAL